MELSFFGVGGKALLVRDLRMDDGIWVVVENEMGGILSTDRSDQWRFCYLGQVFEIKIRRLPGSARWRIPFENVLRGPPPGEVRG